MVTHSEQGEHCQWALSSPIFFQWRVASYNFSDKFSGPQPGRDCDRVTRTAHRRDSEPIKYKRLDQRGHHDAASRSFGAVYSVSAGNNKHRRNMVPDA